MTPAIRTELQRFLDWMYEEGPDPNMVTRDRLLVLYLSWRATTTEDADRDRAAAVSERLAMFN